MRHAAQACATSSDRKACATMYQLTASTTGHEGDLSTMYRHDGAAYRVAR